MQSIPGVPKIKEDQNPAAWMLTISSQTMEYMISVDYAEIFKNSSFYKYYYFFVCVYGA
jgi:hypothetical protein